MVCVWCVCVVYAVDTVQLATHALWVSGGEGACEHHVHSQLSQKHSRNSSKEYIAVQARSGFIHSRPVSCGVSVKHQCRINSRVASWTFELYSCKQKQQILSLNMSQHKGCNIDFNKNELGIVVIKYT